MICYKIEMCYFYATCFYVKHLEIINYTRGVMHFGKNSWNVKNISYKIMSPATEKCAFKKKGVFDCIYLLINLNSFLCS